MAITLTVNQTSEDEKTVYASPGGGGSGQGGDVILTISRVGSQIKLGVIRLFLQPTVTYSNGIYSVRYDLKVYRDDGAASAVKFKFSDLKLNYSDKEKLTQTRYTTSTSISNIPLSGSSVSIGNYSKSDKTWSNKSSVSSKFYITGYITLDWMDSSDFKVFFQTPKVNISFGPDIFKCTFSSNGNPSSYDEQWIGYGKKVNNPGTPGPPNTSLDRQIVVTFNPSPSNDSSIGSTANITDSWNSPSWSPSINKEITGTTDFEYKYERSYSSLPVLIPAWNTQDFKPTRRGYTFNYWSYSNKNIGSEPNTYTSYSFGGDGKSSYESSAVWTENSTTYKIYPKVKYNNALIDIPGGSPINITLKYTETQQVSSIQFKDYTSKGFKLDSSGIYPIDDLLASTENKITILQGSDTRLEFYVLYKIIEDTVTLNLNGGKINNSTNNITIKYDRFTPGISLKDDSYSPVKENTTFVGWLYNDGTSTKYISEIIPEEQTKWPMNRIFYADYIDLGMFVLLRDRLNKPHWYPITNKWIFRNGSWKGEYPVLPGDVVHTSTSLWVFNDGTWKLEYGKTNLPLN